MGIIAWLIFGAIAGWLASKLYGNQGSQGWIGNIVVGIVGAWIGGFVGNLLFFDHGAIEFNISSMILAVIGALILLAVVNFIQKRA
jgi:uncharacterized membrane protein YeaQ/YmgE (transglycosylase-associated protein family)